MPLVLVAERATATTALILMNFPELAPETPRRWQARAMAFKLTYSDGQETDYDDDTAWEVDDGVLKMGRREGEWSVLVSPSHWAVLEVGGSRSKDREDTEDEDTAEKDTADEDPDDAESDEKKEKDGD